jgi:hypothetical protein
VVDIAWPQGIGAAPFALVGIVAGLVLLARGFGGYRAAGRISGTSPSRISGLAVGEVLVAGTVEPMELTLISPLQSAACVYYRSKVIASNDGEGRDQFREERAVGFGLRDASGLVRVFPNGARFDVPERYDESTGSWDGDPIGFAPRTGSVFAPGRDDREAQVAALLTVRDARARSLPGSGGLSIPGSSASRRYLEARIEPGDVVTVLGRAVPFADLRDPASANFVDETGLGPDDPEIAADIAEARAAGILEATPAEAWGNAAIEGFGIGRPVRAPALDPRALRPPPPDADLATRVAATFEIAPRALVLASADDVPLVISLGAPVAVAARQRWLLVVGLLGAALAIAAAMALALALQAVG